MPPPFHCPAPHGRRKLPPRDARQPAAGLADHRRADEHGQHEHGGYAAGRPARRYDAGGGGGGRQHFLSGVRVFSWPVHGGVADRGAADWRTAGTGADRSGVTWHAGARGSRRRALVGPIVGGGAAGIASLELECGGRSRGVGVSACRLTRAGGVLPGLYAAQCRRGARPHPYLAGGRGRRFRRQCAGRLAAGIRARRLAANGRGRHGYRHQSRRLVDGRGVYAGLSAAPAAAPIAHAAAWSLGQCRG